MKKHGRILVVLAILLSGMALVPYVAFPSEPLRWQSFAGAYEPDKVYVAIEDFAFVPQVRIVPVGTEVRWTNNGAVAHTVTSEPAGLFDSGVLQPGKDFRYVFSTPGTYTYRCTLHPSMTGTIIVTTQVQRLYLPLVIN